MFEIYFSNKIVLHCRVSVLLSRYFLFLLAYIQRFPCHDGTTLVRCVITLGQRCIDALCDGHGEEDDVLGLVIQLCK